MTFLNFLDFKLLTQRAKNSRLLRDAFWAIFGNIIGKGLALVAGIIVARFLGKDIFGEYGIIRNALMSISIFSTFGLGYTATKYIAEYKNSRPEYIKLIIRYSRNITLITSGLMALCVLLFANQIAETLLGSKHLTKPLQLVALWIVFNATTTTQIGILAGFGEFKGLARINTIIGVITFITSAVFTYFWKLNGALIATLVTQILNWFLNYLLLRRKIPLIAEHKENGSILLKKILLFSLPVALQEALYSITAWLMSLLLIKLSNYGQLGLYSATMQWHAIILFIPAILRNVILSHLAESNNDVNRFDRVFNYALIFNFSITFIIVLIIYFLSGFIATLYGSTYEGIVSLLQLALLISIINSVINVYNQAFLSKGANWLMFNLKVFLYIGIIALMFLYIKIYGKNYAAFSLLLSNLFMNTLFLISLIIIFNFRYKRNKILLKN